VASSSVLAEALTPVSRAFMPAAMLFAVSAAMVVYVPLLRDPLTTIAWAATVRVAAAPAEAVPVAFWFP